MQNNDNFGGNEYESHSEGNFGGIFNITDKIIQKVMDKLGIEKDQIDKVKELIDMIEFTKIEGDSVMIVKVGENIEVRIKV